jgi:hypothetical protein
MGLDYITLSHIFTIPSIVRLSRPSQGLEPFKSKAISQAHATTRPTSLHRRWLLRLLLILLCPTGPAVFMKPSLRIRHPDPLASKLLPSHRIFLEWEARPSVTEVWAFHISSVVELLLSAAETATGSPDLEKIAMMGVSTVPLVTPALQAASVSLGLHLEMVPASEATQLEPAIQFHLPFLPRLSSMATLLLLLYTLV